MGLRRSGFVRAGFRRAGSSAAGGITTITSTGGSVTITSPNGPTTNLEVAAAPAVVVANIAALDALAAGGMHDGTVAFVMSLDAPFTKTTSALPVTATTRRNANGAAGHQWERNLGYQSLVWQGQATWTVDGSNVSTVASDENTGIDDTHPLLTFAELARRINGTVVPTGQSMNVRVLSNMSAGDGAYLDVNGFTTPTTAPVTGFPINGCLTIVGVPTVTYTGNVTAGAANAANGTVADNRFTDGGAPPAFATAAAIWKKTNSTGGLAWPQKDLTGGAFRTSKLVGGIASRSWVNGDTYQILSLPTIHDLQFPTSKNILRTLVSLVVEATPNTSTLGITGDVHWYACQFTSGGNPGATLFGSSSFVNCRDFLQRTVSQLNSSPINVQSGGLQSVSVGTLPAGIQFVMGGNTTYMSFQGFALGLDFSCIVSEFAGMFYDVAVDCITLAQQQTQIAINSVGGTGNTGKILTVTGLACRAVLVSAGIAAGMTTDGSPFKLNGVVSATANLVDPTTFSCVLAVAASSFPGLTFAAIYNDGAAAADQTATLLNTKGRGVILDGTNAGFDGSTPSLLVKGNTALAAVAALQINGEGSGASPSAIELVNGAAHIRATGNPLGLVSSLGVTLTSGGGNPVEVDTGFAVSKFSDIASAGTITIPVTGGAGPGNVGNITGVATVNFMTIWPSANPIVTLRFPSGLTVKHNAAGPPGGTAVFLLAGAADYVVPAGGKLTVYFDNILGGWVEQSRSS